MLLSAIIKNIAVFYFVAKTELLPLHLLEAL